MNLRARTLELLVFTVGAGTLGAEIAAARLLAPWFGDSTIVWANTIAIVLVALSVGYAVGGRFADRDPHPSGLARIVLLGSVLMAAVPFVAMPFLPLAVRAVDRLSAATFLGSLIGVGVLLAVPLFLLGMVSPYAVRLSVDSVEAAGHTAGRLYAISTVGSLVGTFAAALLLIPVVGTRRTFLVFALAMAATALPHLSRLRVPALLVPALIVALIALPTGRIKSVTDDGAKVVWEKETEYQYARVTEYPDRTRYLELNEGHAVHSTYHAGAWLTGNYWDEMLALSYAGGKAPRSVAILGSAAGTTARQIAHFSPATRVDAVEIDGAVTAVGRRLFDLHGTDLHTHTADARPWLASQSRRYDVIMVDAYRQPYIPFYMTTHEFFEEVRRHLAPGGLVVVNSAHPEGSTTLEKVLTATIGSAFGDTVWRDAATPTNTQLVASTDRAAKPSEQLLAAAQRQASPALTEVLADTSSRLAPGLRGGRVYTDDVAPVEWLTDMSLADVAE